MAANSIIRVINTKAMTEEENKRIVKRHLEYILRKDATYSDLCWVNMVDMDNILESFGFFSKCVGKNNKRPLKHIVLSYAVEDEQTRLDWQEYLSVTKEIAKFYSLDYQMVAAVHNNIKKRPHAHIVMDCFNVSTGKKFSEGVNELERFKDFIDDILKQHKIPQLLRKINKVDDLKSVETDMDRSLVTGRFYEGLYYADKFKNSFDREVYLSDEITVNDEVNNFFAVVDNTSFLEKYAEDDVFDEISAFLMEETEEKNILFSFKKLLEE